jgi:uncharacterized protein YecT (DUF1311 family)
MSLGWNVWLAMAYASAIEQTLILEANMKNIQIVFAFALCALSVNFSAISAAPTAQNTSDATGLRSSYEKCVDASGGVTVAMLDCDGPEYDYQNKRLDKAYKSFMEKLNTSDQAKLREEEKKWIAYRAYYCAPDPDSGTAADVGSSACFVAETAKQATALEARPGQPAVLSQYEGKKNGLRSAYTKCIEETRGIGPESQSCMEAEYKYQDARLNKVYQALIAKLSASEQAKLRADEKIWIAFRDTHCAPTTDGDKAQRLMPNDCLVEETAKQAFVLEARLSLL